jgi:chorismate mutase
MTIEELRRKIDELDARLVELLNERARLAQEVGRRKRETRLPVYEPERERMILENVRRHNRGPLTEQELEQVYERVVDVMRAIQHRKIAHKAKPEGRG